MATDNTNPLYNFLEDNKGDMKEGAYLKGMNLCKKLHQRKSNVYLMTYVRLTFGVDFENKEIEPVYQKATCLVKLSDEQVCYIKETNIASLGHGHFGQKGSCCPWDVGNFRKLGFQISPLDYDEEVNYFSLPIRDVIVISLEPVPSEKEPEV